MAFTRDWSESRILDHIKNKLWPSMDRSIQVDISDRLKSILSGFTSGETIYGIKLGKFITVGTGNASTPTGTGSAASIDLFGKTVSGKVELCTIDGDGNVIQLTNGGVIAPWRTGDLLFSTNTGTPSDFTDITETYDGKFIRISTGTALDTGGVDSHTHTTPGLTTSAAGAHTHTRGAASTGCFQDTDGDGKITDEEAAHTHTTAEDDTGSADNVPAYVQLRLYMKD